MRRSLSLVGGNPSVTGRAACLRNVAIIIALLGCVLAPVQVIAQQSGTALATTLAIGESFDANLRLPAKTADSIGVTLDVAVAGWSLPGYGDVTLTLRSAAAASADQSFVVTFDSSQFSPLPPDRGSVVRIPMLLSEGEREVVVRKRVPCYCLCSRIAVSLSTGQGVIDRYRGQIKTPYDDVGGSDAALDRYLNTQFNLEVQDPSSLVRRPASMPDAVVIDDPQALSERPSAVDAIRRYLLRGGLAVSRKEMGLDQWNETLNLDMTRTNRDASLIPMAAAGRTDGMEPRPPASIDVASVGAGQLIQPKSDVGVDDDTKQDWTGAPMGLLIGGIDETRASSAIIRGVDPMLGDSRFTQWLVPGVAQPPVYTFIGLLSAFVILVGPVAYRRTTKSGRGYLMFLIAPVLALLTTVSMFAYGIVADGFGTIVRVRQITYVDGKTGDAGERSRVTYFSGIRPREGVRFDSEWSVFPYPEPIAGASWESTATIEPQSMGTVRIDDQHQIFDASFLPSRQHRQFVVEANRQSIGGLRLVTSPSTDSGASDRSGADQATGVEQADASEPVTGSEPATDAEPAAGATTTNPTQVEVRNNFDFDLRRLIVRDDDGNYWVADLAAAGSITSLSPPQNTTPSILMGGLYNDFRAIAAVNQNRQFDYGGGTRDLIATANGLVGAGTIQVEGEFETMLNDRLKTNATLPVGSFVAISDPSPDMIGVDNAESADGVRYVLGTLQR